MLLVLAGGVWTEAPVPIIISSVSWIDLVTLLVLPVILPLLIGFVGKVQTLPTFWKRLILAGLALVTTVLTELVQSVASVTPYDLGMTLLRAVTIYVASEATYYGFLKAPLERDKVVEVDNPQPDFDAMTVAQLRAFLGVLAPNGALKADLVRIAQEKAGSFVTVTVEKPGKSIASIVQNHGS